MQLRAVSVALAVVLVRQFPLQRDAAHLVTGGTSLLQPFQLGFEHCPPFLQRTFLVLDALFAGHA